jgi:hypothetical protein
MKKSELKQLIREVIGENSHEQAEVQKLIPNFHQFIKQLEPEYTNFVKKMKAYRINLQHDNFYKDFISLLVKAGEVSVTDTVEDLNRQIKDPFYVPGSGKKMTEVSTIGYSENNPGREDKFHHRIYDIKQALKPLGFEVYFVYHYGGEEEPMEANIEIKNKKTGKIVEFTLVEKKKLKLNVGGKTIAI